MTDTNEEVREMPAWIAKCATCDRIVDTREKAEGGDPHGCEVKDGQWACSVECYEVQIGDAPPPAVPDAVGVRDTFTEAEAVANQLRGSLSREDEDGAILNSADIIRRAVVALSSIEPTLSPEPQASNAGAVDRATPRPWHIDGTAGRALTIRSGEKPIAELWYNGNDPHANAALIVDAVNARFAALSTPEPQTGERDGEVERRLAEVEERARLALALMPQLKDELQHVHNPITMNNIGYYLQQLDAALRAKPEAQAIVGKEGDQ